MPGLNALGMIVCMLLYPLLHAHGLEPQGPGQFGLYLLGLMGLSIALSWVSYRWMERPIMARAR